MATALIGHAQELQFCCKKVVKVNLQPLHGLMTSMTIKDGKETPALPMSQPRDRQGINDLVSILHVGPVLLVLILRDADEQLCVRPTLEPGRGLPIELTG